jgi:hypothetical protein
VRNFVTFDSTFEDDMVLGEQGEMAAPPGKNVMSWLRDELQSADLKCSGVDAHSFYGWSFDVVEGTQTVWCMLQRSDCWLLISEPRRGFVDWIRGRRYEALHERVLEAIESALRSSAKISGVQRVTQDEFAAAARPERGSRTTE